MKKIADYLIEKAKSYILPMLLAATVAFDIINCYYIEKVWLYTIAFFVFGFMFFLIFDWLKKKKYWGAIVYILIFASFMVFAGFSFISGVRNSGIVFTDWFYLERVNSGFSMEYFNTLFYGGGFFLLSVIYYFTQVIYRSLGSMLCVLLPFVIYAKRADNLTDLQVAVLITVYLAVMVHNRQISQKDNKIKIKINLSYVISIALFVSFVGAVAMIIPKPDVKSQLELNPSTFNYNAPDTDDAEEDYSSTNNKSSARSGSKPTNQILFYYESTHKESVHYLRRQGYDGFHDNYWVLDYTSDKYDRPEFMTTTQINRSEMFDSLKKLADTGKYEKYGLTSDAFSKVTVQKSTFRVFDDDFIPYYLPAPMGTIAQTYMESGVSSSIAMTLYGDIVLKFPNSKKFDYTTEYYPETDDYKKFASSFNISGENYEKLLEEAYYNGDIEDKSLYDEYQIISEYYLNDIEYSERMKTLAQEITKDCKNDYEKAQALCSYFEQNDYVYDLEYVPKDDSIDYFVFNSKTGSCSSFATAMTLMARLVNLPTRYVEGFVAYEETDDGVMVIRDSHAHAFVEVYIVGAGWITFDPTVSDYIIDHSKKSSFNFEVFLKYLGKILIFLGVLFFILVVVLFDRILELIFRIRLKFARSNKKIIMLYNHMLKLLMFSSKDGLEAYTPNMIIEYVYVNRFVSVEEIARLFEKTCYGEINLDLNEFYRVYSIYKSVYKYLRKVPKKR